MRAPLAERLAGSGDGPLPSPARESDRARRGLVTLFDMLRFHFDRMLGQIVDLPGYVRSLKTTPNYPGEPTPQEQVDALLSVLERDCEELKLPVSRAQVSEIRRRISVDWPRPSEEQWTNLVTEFVERLKVEAGRQIYFQIEPEHEAFVVDELDAHLFLRIVFAFPATLYDLAHASRCYAFGEHTASVFHSMRAIEEAARALAVAVGVKWDADQLRHRQIGEVLKAIRGKVEALRNDNTTSKEKKDPAIEFYQRAATQLERAKDGWRAPVAHRERFDQGQALRVLQTTKDLLEQLSEAGYCENQEP